MNLEIAYVATTDLIPYANNPRTHSEQQVAQVAASIQEFGFNNPILIDEHNSIIAGHGRLAAAQKLDMNTVPTILLEGLSEAQRKAYVIADNKLGLNSGWDDDLLRVEIERLGELDFDLDILGWDVVPEFVDEPDYSLLDDESLSDEVDDIGRGVKKAIQIEFEVDHYEEAQELVGWWRSQGAYVGFMMMQYLRSERDKVNVEA